jgi:hypothetical protein
MPNSRRSRPGGIPDVSKLNRLAGIVHPTFVANDDNDEMMRTKNSYLLGEHLPTQTSGSTRTPITLWPSSATSDSLTRTYRARPAVSRRF